MPARHFKTLFCEQFNCSPDDYEEKAFKTLLYFHARPLAPIIRILKPDFFQADFKFIRYLGESEDYREAADSIADFRESNMRRCGILRKNFKIRVSGGASGRLVRKMLCG